MPPKISSRSSIKRKNEVTAEAPEAPDVEGGVEGVANEVVVSKSQSTNKRQKIQEGTNGGSSEPSSSLGPNGQPTNKVLPVHISFPDKSPGSTRIATWNLSGLAAAQKKGFKYYVEAEDPDILILTETKVNNVPVDSTITSRFPHGFWSIAEKKGYSGTAILSKHKPITSTQTLPGHHDPSAVKGRLVTLEFEKVFLVGTYVTNAGQDLKTLSAKEEWNKHFTEYIRELDSKKPVIWVGDLNVAPTEIDLTNAKKNWNKTPGYTESETKAFAKILDPSTAGDTSSNTKFVDVWRHLHPDIKHYTYFGYRFNCRAKGIGWRLDMFVLSERLVENVKMCEIRSEIYGASDHCPVVMEIEGII